MTRHSIARASHGPRLTYDLEALALTVGMQIDRVAIGRGEGGGAVNIRLGRAAARGD